MVSFTIEYYSSMKQMEACSMQQFVYKSCYGKGVKKNKIQNKMIKWSERTKLYHTLAEHKATKQCIRYTKWKQTWEMINRVVV